MLFERAFKYAQLEKQLYDQGYEPDDYFKRDATGMIVDIGLRGGLEPQLIKLTDDECMQFYQSSEWVHALVQRIVTDVTKHPPRVVPVRRDTKPGENTQMRMEVVRRKLEDPNKNKESFTEIRKKVVKDMLVYGRGTMEKVVNIRSRRLTEIYTLPARFMRKNPDKHGMLPNKKAYREMNPQDGSDIFFDKDEVIFMLFEPTTDLAYGTKPLDALANTISADILAANYNSNFFLNNAEASGVISLDGMKKSEIEKFKKWWRTEFKSTRNAHKLAVVNVPAKFERMAITNRDMQFMEYANHLLLKMHAVFGIPPFITGLIDRSTGRLNSAEQVELYRNQTIKPILDIEAYHYTMEIVRSGFGFADIKIEFPSVDMLDRVRQNRIDVESVVNGIATINEIRRERGMPDVKWGDEPLSVQEAKRQQQGKPPSDNRTPSADQGGGGPDQQREDDSRREMPAQRLFFQSNQ